METLNIAMEDVCDTGLVLGLGRCNPSFKSKPSSATPKVDLEPSLTLALSDGTYRSNSKEAKEANWQSTPSPHSTNSSFSSAHPSKVKRENDVMGNEETKRVSSRTSDEEEEGGVRKKLRLTKEQSALLEDKFKEHTTLNPKQKQALAKQLNLRPRQVEVWFQNRRARTKLKQTEVDCEVLKRCYETLSDENRRLQKELEELKALKLTTSPIYMQMTAAAAATTAVTVCPSCERVSGVTEGATAGPFVVAAPKAQFLNPFARSAAC